MAKKTPRKDNPAIPKLRIKLEGKEYVVPRKAYAIKKTKQLQEFGYPTLTVDELEEQIDALLAKKELGKGLTVVGMFMEGEVLELVNKNSKPE